MQIEVVLANIQQAMRIIPIIATNFKRLIGALKEYQSQTIALVLLADMRHTRVDATTIDRVINM